MSSIDPKKPKIIYERLKDEYSDFKTWGDFADYFGMSRQAIHDRKNRDTLDYEEIEEKFPDINTRWLYSKDIRELKSLPVKKSLTNDEQVNYQSHSQDKGFHDVVEKAKHLMSLQEQGKVSEPQQDDLVRSLEAAESLIRLALNIVKKK